MDDIKTKYFEYPAALLDDEGYPTPEALMYIKNWSFAFIDGEFVAGKYWQDPNLIEGLIYYLKTIWYYKDAIVYKDGLLELHTLGWSGNEDVIRALEKTTLWTMKLQATQLGGHYYFRIDKNSKQNWRVVKVDCE